MLLCGVAASFAVFWVVVFTPSVRVAKVAGAADVRIEPAIQFTESFIVLILPDGYTPLTVNLNCSICEWLLRGVSALVKV